MGAGGQASMYEGIAGGTLGGIGDIVNAASHKKLSFPGPTGGETRLRNWTMQQLRNAQQTYNEGQGLYNQSLPMMYNSIPGVSATMQYDPQAQAQFQQLEGQMGNRLNTTDQLLQARANVRGMKPGAARRSARQNVKSIRRTLKGMPSLDELNNRLGGSIANGPQMQLTKNAPTQTDQNAQAIQDQLSNRMLTALNGGNANPMLEKNLAQQQDQMQQQMEAQLGPDWANSSAGIRAMNDFHQYANAQRDQSNRNDISSLYQEQLGGQGAQLGFAGQFQNLLTNPSSGEMNMGQMRAALGGAFTSAQQPYQFDRSGGMVANQANFGYGNPWGHALQQSGDRWASIAGGGGGGGGGMPTGPSGGGGGGPSMVEQSYAVDY